MRLHHLDITAFGPFADAVAVDLEALSSAGLFLLSGPTGAGKTSVLDAVCFALYGDVPGDRSSAKRLRSDHARPDQVPEVVLEATLAGRRFRFRRSPAWERPKKRGTGTTRQQATVVLSERIDGDWQPVSTRLDEVGDLVTTLVGMNLTQFCQVAMLPQGRFQEFLRARSDERQALLQQLFRTERFSRVEGWLRERRLELHRVSRGCHDEVAGLVNRLSEAASLPCPDAWDLRALETPAAEGHLIVWMTRGLERLQAAVATLAASRTVAAGRASAADEQLAAGRGLAERAGRYAEAVLAWDRLEAEASTHRSRVEERDAARRAAAVSPLHELACAARQRLDLHEDRLRSLQAELSTLHVDERDPGEVLSDVEAEQERLGPLRDAETGLLTWEETIRTRSCELQAARASRDQAQRDVAALPQHRIQVETALRAARGALDRRDPLQERHQTLQRSLEAHHEATSLAEQVEVLQDERRSWQDRVHQLTEDWFELREARLSGMAAEIATGLAAGCECPVCGSAEHPRPAAPVPGAPDAAGEREAQRRVDDARVTLTAFDDQLQQLRTRLQHTRARAGDRSPEELRQLLEATAVDLTVLEEQADSLPSLEEELAALEQDERDAQARLVAAERDTAGLEVALREVEERHHRTTARIGAALAGTGHATVTARCTHLTRVGSLLRELTSVARTVTALTEECHEHDRRVETALADQEFEHLAAMIAARRDDDACRELEDAVAHHERECHRWRAVLDDPDLHEAARAPQPDLVALESVHQALRTEVEDLTTQEDRAARSLDRAQSLAESLREAIVRWEPVRQEHTLVAGLASFVEGKSADNRLQMRLSAYVLGYRLGQVVDAANIRLSRMSDQRYRLLHTVGRSTGNSRGGLGLAVSDEWSGIARDPATLSGGESFIVSLALALGLADVITQEAGGSDLDTLFVDEGFGSLDADSLDHVLDTLDSLRDGGRVVGVVSHVSEMAERIPTQLQVLKHRAGSTVRLRIG